MTENKLERISSIKLPTTTRTLSIILSILLTFTSLPKNHCWVNKLNAKTKRIKSRIILSNNGNGIFYDDFEDFNNPQTDEQQDKSTISSLNTKLQENKLKEMDKSFRIQNNLLDGNWNVRGFSLDKNSEDGDDVISITALGNSGSDEFNDIVVGRSDGSVFWIALGTDYLTSFTSVTSLKFDDSNDDTSGGDLDEGSVTLRKETNLVDKDTLFDYGKTGNDAGYVSRPFQILHQFQSSYKEPVSCIVFDDDSMILHVTSGTSIQKWKLEPDDTAWKEVLLHDTTSVSSTVHKTPIHTLKLINNDLVVSISNDCVVIWDDAQVIIRPVEDNTTPLLIQSADYNSNYSLLFLGMQNGYIYVYNLSITNQQEKPIYKFPAYTDDTISITSLQCITCPQEKQQTSSQYKNSILLYTGGSNGILKQYQMFLQQGKDGIKLQHWPRMKNQRVSYKNSAHIFTSQHVGYITCCIVSLLDDIVLSAGSDGRIIIHSLSTGKSLYSMEGFTESRDKISNMLYSSKDGMLISNGMLDYVCVHDFNVKEWEEDSDDFSDWLDFDLNE